MRKNAPIVTADRHGEKQLCQIQTTQLCTIIRRGVFANGVHCIESCRELRHSLVLFQFGQRLLSGWQFWIDVQGAKEEKPSFLFIGFDTQTIVITFPRFDATDREI